MTVNWHERYKEQAGWTRQTREYLLSKVDFALPKKVLDVGCGTGALFPDFEKSNLTGVDIDHGNLRVAIKGDTKKDLVQGDGYHLPFSTGSYDVVFCHYVLLWVRQPILFLEEMKRVLKPGGCLLLFAESDYQARIDTPEEQKQIGNLQNASLEKQGVDLETGRKLAGYLEQIGCTKIMTGVVGGEWDRSTRSATLEQQVLRSDLQKIGVEDIMSSDQAGSLTYIPTFYAMAYR